MLSVIINRTDEIFTILPAVVPHKANDGLVYAMPSARGKLKLKYDTALSGMVESRTAYSLIH